MDGDTREVWTSLKAILSTALAMALVAALLVVLVSVLLGRTRDLHQGNPVPRIIPVLFCLIVIGAVLLQVRPLAWRVVVSESEVVVHHLLRRRRTVPLSALGGLQEAQRGPFASLVLKTDAGEFLVTPCPPAESGVVRRLELAVRSASGHPPTTHADSRPRS